MVESAKNRYEDLCQKRDPFLDRAQAAARFTIPALFPPDGHNSTQDLPQPYQSLGAEGVNNLASKLLLALFPPANPFFKFVADEFQVQEQSEEDADLRAEVEKTLSMMESVVMSELEVTNDRVSLFEGFKQLLVGGNTLLHLLDKGIRVFRLDSYVVKRDPQGNILEIITKEILSTKSMPAKLRRFLQLDMEKEKEVEVYTYIKRNGNHYKTHQEVKGATIPESEGTYPLDKLPYIPLRYNKVDGEDYGRGFIEEYYGDIRSLDGLSRAILEGAVAAARTILMVDPKATITMKDIEKALNGQPIVGRDGEVSFVQVNKTNDFNTAAQQIIRLEQRLSRAFLLMTAIQRDAERVTAEEIRLMAQELDDSQGGLFSILSQELQLPYVNVRVGQLQKAGKLPFFDKSVVKLSVVTGFQALGRGHELQKMQIWLRNMQEALGPQVLAEYLDVPGIMKRFGAAIALDLSGLIKSEEDVQQARQTAQLNEAAQALGPQAIQAAAQAAGQ